MSTKNLAVMRHGKINPKNKPDTLTVERIKKNADSLKAIAKGTKIIVYHSETERAEVTAKLLVHALTDIHHEAVVGGFLEELDSTDPLLRHAMQMEVEDGTFVVLISHEPFMEQVFSKKGIDYCEMFFA